MSVDRCWRAVSAAFVLLMLAFAWTGDLVPCLLLVIATLLVTILRRLNDLQTAAETLIRQNEGPQDA